MDGKRLSIVPTDNVLGIPTTGQFRVFVDGAGEFTELFLDAASVEPFLIYPGHMEPDEMWSVWRAFVTSRQAALAEGRAGLLKEVKDFLRDIFGVERAIRPLKESVDGLTENTAMLGDHVEHLWKAMRR